MRKEKEGPVDKVAEDLVLSFVAYNKEDMRSPKMSEDLASGAFSEFRDENSSADKYVTLALGLRQTLSLEGTLAFMKRALEEEKSRTRKAFETKVTSMVTKNRNEFESRVALLTDEKLKEDMSPEKKAEVQRKVREAQSIRFLDALQKKVGKKKVGSVEHAALTQLMGELSEKKEARPPPLSPTIGQMHSKKKAPLGFLAQLQARQASPPQAEEQAPEKKVKATPARGKDLQARQASPASQKKMINELTAVLQQRVVNGGGKIDPKRVANLAGMFGGPRGPPSRRPPASASAPPPSPVSKVEMSAEERVGAFREVLTKRPDLWDFMWGMWVKRMDDSSLKILQFLPELKQIRRADDVLRDEEMSLEEKESHEKLRDRILNKYAAMSTSSSGQNRFSSSVSGAEKVDGVEARALRSLLRRISGALSGEMKVIYNSTMEKLKKREEQPRGQLFTNVAMPPVGPFWGAVIPDRLLHAETTKLLSSEEDAARRKEEVSRINRGGNAGVRGGEGRCNYFHGGQTNTMTSTGDDEIVDQMKALLEKFMDYEAESEEIISKRNEVNPLYVPGKSCPTGLTPCDPSARECPDEKYAVVPAVYNSDGLRCFTREGVAYKSRTAKKRETQVKMREFVEQAAKLSADLQGKLDAVKNCSALTTRELCGMKDSCAWDGAANTCGDASSSS